MTHPCGRRERRREARQPRVRVAVGGTRLRGEGAAVAQARRRVVLAGRRRQQCGRLVCNIRGDDLLAVRRELLQDVLVTVGHRLDGLRRALLAGVCDRREHGRHLQRGARHGTKDVGREGRRNLTVLRDAHVIGGLEDGAEVHTRRHVDEGLVGGQARRAHDVHGAGLACEVVDLVALSGDGAAITLEGSVGVERVVRTYGLVCRVAFLEPLQEGEHLEGRTNLEVAVGRVVRHRLAALDAVRRILGHR